MTPIPQLRRASGGDIGDALMLGTLDYRGTRRRFGVPQADRLRHMAVIGATGVGKSTLLEHLIVQDLEAGRGLALLDPHGTLVRAVLPRIPAHRQRDVALLRPTDTAYPIALNVFRPSGRPPADLGLLAAHIVALCKAQWASSWGPRLEHVLRNAVLAVGEQSDATLVLLYRFLIDEGLRERVAARVRDPVVRGFWTREFAGYSTSLKADALAPVQNKIGAFVSIPAVRAIVGQPRTRLRLGELIGNRSVLLADLAVGAIGADAANLLGGLLLLSLHYAAWERATSGRASTPTTVYLDEYQNLVSGTLPTMLAESRKFGLGLVLANQYLAQVPESLRDAVLANAGTVVAFRVGPDDADVLAPIFGPDITPADLTALGPGRIAARVLAGGEALPGIVGQTDPPSAAPPDVGSIEHVVALSRSRFASRHARALAAAAHALRIKS